MADDSSISGGGLLLVLTVAAAGMGIFQYVSPLIFSVTGGRDVLSAGVVALLLGTGIVYDMGSGRALDYILAATAGLTGISVVMAMGAVYQRGLRQVFASSEFIQAGGGPDVRLMFAAGYGLFLAPFLYAYGRDGGRASWYLAWLAVPVLVYLGIVELGTLLFL